MNIFILHSQPEWAAIMHCDKHVVKMIVETAQLLSTALEQHQPEWFEPGSVYKPTHANHPCAVWVRETWANYMWTWRLLVALCKEYTFRYKKTHATARHIDALCVPSQAVAPSRITQPAQAMPEKYKRPKKPVAAYRAYYIGDKARIATWKNRQAPEWWPYEV